MARNSRSFRRLPWPVLLLIAGFVGCRQLQQKEAPQKTSKSTKNQSATRRNTPQDRPGNNSGAPSGSNRNSSNEGNLLLGNPTNAARTADNFLLERATYSLSYNQQNGGPNWVAWHTDASNLGVLDRGDNFAPDPNLPPEWQIRPTDYRGSGYDRGHVCPSGDRTASRDDNTATFYMSNMLPQTGSLNRHVWADLENYLRDQIRAGNEIYEVAGGAGSAGRIAKGKVNVPQICWKVAVIIPAGSGDLRRINAKTRVLAVGMPNVDDKRLESGNWRSYLTTVSKIQSATKLDLLSALPDSTERALESQTDAGN
ncbi:endonuclease G [Abditibacterium utsteinense]|uniref:Endonuclease G n=1 Tax=Abditibacterium utsteinense TaxID=1960156 RepID=A0A2S8SSV0_9BACT|nr:DNA/RNA non-specific endonuclease [Abditibacterium utsteinense]PQV63865.1 endonuclease G [Abditibacterium utsteinense]